MVFIRSTVNSPLQRLRYRGCTGFYRVFTTGQRVRGWNAADGRQSTATRAATRHLSRHTHTHTQVKLPTATAGCQVWRGGFSSPSRPLSRRPVSRSEEAVGPVSSEASLADAKLIKPLAPTRRSVRPLGPDTGPKRKKPNPNCCPKGFPFCSSGTWYTYFFRVCVYTAAAGPLLTVLLNQVAAEKQCRWEATGQPPIFA